MATATKIKKVPVHAPAIAVYPDMVTIIAEGGKPTTCVIKHGGHDLFFSLRECHGSSVTDILKNMVTASVSAGEKQSELEKMADEQTQKTFGRTIISKD